MANTKHIEEYYQALQTRWNEDLEAFEEARDIKDQNLFSAIEYLTLCDAFSSEIYTHLKEIHGFLEKLKGNKENQLVADLNEINNEMQAKMQSIEEEYIVISEDILRQAQDEIAKRTTAIQNKKLSPTLSNEITQSLEKELFLQELHDSLEAYREARERFVSEIEMDSKKHLPEDLGEEMPQIDSILSLLDETITECNAALLIQGISD